MKPQETKMALADNPADGQISVVISIISFAAWAYLMAGMVDNEESVSFFVLFMFVGNAFGVFLGVIAIVKRSCEKVFSITGLVLNMISLILIGLLLMAVNAASTYD